MSINATRKAIVLQGLCFEQTNRSHRIGMSLETTSWRYRIAFPAPQTHWGILCGASVITRITTARQDMLIVECHGNDFISMTSIQELLTSDLVATNDIYQYSERWNPSWDDVGRISSKQTQKGFLNNKIPMNWNNWKKHYSPFSKHCTTENKYYKTWKKQKNTSKTWQTLKNWNDIKIIWTNSFRLWSFLPLSQWTTCKAPLNSPATRSVSSVTQQRTKLLKAKTWVTL